MLDYTDEGEKVSSPSMVVDEVATVRMFNQVDKFFTSEYTFHPGDIITDVRLQNLIKNSGKQYHFE